MIEFTGYLTDVAEKAFIKETRKTVLLGACIVIPLTLPSIFLIGMCVLHDNAFIYAMLVALIIGIIIILVPKGKKEHKSMLPKRIYVDKKHIVCVSDRYSDSRLLADVQKVLDYGNYYRICFPFGKSSEKFICQKDLLTRGSLDEFEKLFEGKIIKKQ